MNATAARHQETTLLYDVPWKAYTGLIDALPEHRIRHTYQSGTLELFNNVLYFVPWKAYEKILKAFGDRRFPHTYQEGTLEIMMSPSPTHEQIKSFLGRVVEMACLESGIHFKAIGSTTQRDKSLLQGLEPDESFCIPYVPPRRAKAGGEPAASPVPDLVIEIDLRKLELSRMKSYAKLGVREFWRYRKTKLEFFVLSSKGKYELVESSFAFPLIGSADIARFLAEMRATDDYIATQSFLDWFRKQRLKAKK